MDMRQNSGKRRGAGQQRLRQAGGISHGSREKLIRGFSLRLLHHGWHSRAHRTIAHDLAKWTERIWILRGVQVGSTRVRNLANPDYFCVVVKNFGTKEMNFAGEQHPHHQGLGPILVSIFSSVSQAYAATFGI